MSELPSFAIDVRMADRTGIGRYIRGIVSSLEPSPLCRYVFVGSHKIQSHIPSNWPFISTEVPIYSVQEQMVMPRLAGQAAGLHVPHYNAPVFWKKKLVVTVHDLIHIHFKEHLSSLVAAWYGETMLRRIVKQADRIITVSEATKNDLIRTLNADPRKITVIHHGIDSSFLNDDQGEPSASRKIASLYFLYVGLIKAHKNVGVLLNAFTHLKKNSEFKNVKLILIGKTDSKQRIVREWLGKMKSEPDIQLIDYANDAELKQYYRNAAAFISPSLCEGFGFPLIEAMASKVPVIASRIEATMEVLGDTGLYFEAQSSIELEKQMKRIIEEPHLRSRLTTVAFKRLSLFDWHRAAKQTKEVYESVLSS